MKNISLLPRLSEKTYGLSERRVYVLDVPKNSNKLIIKQAVESQFDVKVSHVNIANISGKAKRTVSKNGRRVAKGRDSDVKKAYVTLSDGFSLPFFQAIEEEEKQTEKLQQEFEKQENESSKPKRRSPRLKKDSEVKK